MSSMAQRGNSHSRRRSQIADLVRAQGWARIDDLADQFGVSTMTIHRDLDHLDSQGMLRKVRSGAEAPPSEAFERNVDLRRTLNLVEKKAVANAGFAWAAERVEMQAVALDDSTTALNVLPRLLEHLPLTVVTNFLPVINQLAADPRVRLNAIGGDYEPDFSAFLGSQAIGAVQAVHYDVLFMSVPAVTRGSCFHPSSAAADLKRAFMSSAELRVLLVDHTKTERRAVHRICALADFDAVVVDSGLEESEVERLRTSGANVVVAPTPALSPGTPPSTSVRREGDTAQGPSSPEPEDQP
jgi:DeoR/GlpR family transcriptional regulator of sugar metabolism